MATDMAWLTRLLLSLLVVLPTSDASQSPKRGLVFIPNSKTPADNRIWAPPSTDLTWYYNYGANPSPIYDVVSQNTFEFVPMMWGLSDNPEETTFLDNVKNLITQGRKITHVLTLNDPDASWELGGSNVEPAVAAKAWVANIVPLRKMGIKVALPSLLPSHDPTTWMKPFLANCSAILKEECAYDFLGLHIFGDMEELTGRINNFTAAFPNTPIWVLEYALHSQALPATQRFFNASVEYLDKLDIVERYAYFGSFRGSVSNVGPNVAMLDSRGLLTDIGRWYLGGNPVQNAASSATAAMSTLAWGYCWAVGSVMLSLAIQGWLNL